MCSLFVLSSRYVLTLQNFSLAPLLRHIFNGGTRKWDAVDGDDIGAPLGDEEDTLTHWYACVDRSLLVPSRSICSSLLSLVDRDAIGLCFEVIIYCIL